MHSQFYSHYLRRVLILNDLLSHCLCQNTDWARNSKGIVGEVDKTVVSMFALQKDYFTMFRIPGLIDIKLIERTKFVLSSAKSVFEWGN